MSQPIHINPTLIASPNWSEVSCWTSEKARITASSLVCQDWVNWHLPTVDELLLMKEDGRVTLKGNEYWVRTDSGVGVYSIPYREVFHELEERSATGRQAYVRAVQTQQISKREPIPESDEMEALPSLTELIIEFIRTLRIGTEEDTVLWPEAVVRDTVNTHNSGSKRELLCSATFNPDHEVYLNATQDLDDGTNFWTTVSFKVTYLNKTRPNSNVRIIEITKETAAKNAKLQGSLSYLCNTIESQEERLSGKRNKENILRSLACLRQVVNKE